MLQNLNYLMFVKVKVKTGAKKELIVEKKSDVFEVSVKEKAERNMANHRVISIMSKRLKVPENKVRIKSGHHKPSKILEIMD